MINNETKVEMVECPRCAGEGEEYPPTPIGRGIIVDPSPCTLCSAYGEVEPYVARGYVKRGGPFRG